MSTFNIPYSSQEFSGGINRLDFSQFLASGFFDEEDTNQNNSKNFIPNVSASNLPVASELIGIEQELDQLSTTSTSTYATQVHRSNSVTTTATSYASPNSGCCGNGSVQFLHKSIRFNSSQSLQTVQQPQPFQQKLAFTEKVPSSSNALDPLLITFNEDEVSDIEADNFLNLSSPNSPNKGGISIYVNENQELVMSFESDAATITRTPTPDELEVRQESQLPSSPIDFFNCRPVNQSDVAVVVDSHHPFAHSNVAVVDSPRYQFIQGGGTTFDSQHHSFTPGLNSGLNSGLDSAPITVASDFPQVVAPVPSVPRFVSSPRLSAGIQYQQPSSQRSYSYQMILHNNSDINTCHSNSSDKIQQLKENLNLLPAFDFQGTNIITTPTPTLVNQGNSELDKSDLGKVKDATPTPPVSKKRIIRKRKREFPPSSPTTISPKSVLPKTEVAGPLSVQLVLPEIAPASVPASTSTPAPKRSRRPRRPEFDRKPRKISPKTDLISSDNKYSCEYSLTFQFKKRKAEYIHLVTYAELKSKIYNGTYPDYTQTHDDFDEQEKSGTNLRSDIYCIGPKILPLPFSREFMNLKSTTFIPLSECKLNSKYQLPKGQKSNYNLLKKNDVHYPTELDDVKLGPCRLKFMEDDDIESKKIPKRFKKTPKKYCPEMEGCCDVRTDRYYSRLNIYELSKILELDGFQISLTKEIEVKILELFGNYCDFKLGYQTWIRDTSKEKRAELIDKLYSYSSVFYPEIDRFKLEVIIRRGSYSLMQTRLRRERRMYNHMERPKYKSS